MKRNGDGTITVDQDALILLMNECELAENKFKSIALLGGTLGDATLTERTGPNDAVSRGLMYAEARRIALSALGNYKFPMTAEEIENFINDM